MKPPPLLVIRNARVATMTGAQTLTGEGPLALLEDGAVACEGDRIAWVGKSDAAPAGKSIDAKGMLLSPGLIDPHTHAVFAGDRAGEHGQRLGGASYLEIAAKGGGIRSTVKATRAASDETLLKSATKRLRLKLECGVTTVEVKTGYGLGVSQELRLLRIALAAGRAAGCEVVPTLLGLHAMPENTDREEWLEQVVHDLLPKAAKHGARGCDAFCEQGAFTPDECARALNRGRKLGLTPHLHADQLSDTGGAMLAAELGCASADHLERASLKGIEAMGRAGTAAVLLPLAAWFLRDKPALAAPFLQAGVTVALGSNLNPGSQRIESVSMLLAAGCLFCGLTPAQSLWACTRGAARALRLEEDRGSIAKGMRADLVLFEARGADHLAYHAGIEHARVVIKNGAVVHQAAPMCF